MQVTAPQRPPLFNLQLQCRYDNDVAKDEYTAVTALGDATSLLWRLEMLKNPKLHPPMPISISSSSSSNSGSGGSSGGASSSSSGSAGPGRWTALSARWAPYLPPQDISSAPPAAWWPTAGSRASGAPPVLSRWYAWNDVHAVMALSMAGEREGCQRAREDCATLLAGMASVAAGATAAVGEGGIHGSFTGGGGSGGGGRGAALPSAAAGDTAWLTATLGALGVARPLGLFSALGGFGGGGGGTTGRQDSSSGGGGGGSSGGRGGGFVSEQARVTALVGLDTALGCAAFARGDAAGAVVHLSAAAPHWGRMGGSHVQRDVFEATLLDALCTAGGGGRAPPSPGLERAASEGRMLASARVTLKPNSPQRWWSLGAALEASGKGFAAGAQGAKNRAHALGLNQGPGY